MYIFKQKGIVLGDSKEIDNLNLREFIGFLRPKLVSYITAIALTGYLLFHPIAFRLAYLALSSFLIATAMFSYNLITDRKEDLANNKKLNWFVVNKAGIVFVNIFWVSSIFFSLFLSNASFLIICVLSILGFIYSKFRVKKIFPFKNVYTAFTISTMFLFGALSSPGVTIEKVAFPYALSTVIVLILSLLGDLRDCKGDKCTGVTTIPVVIGYGNTKKIVYALFALLALLVLSYKNQLFYPLIAFNLLAISFLNKNNPVKSQESVILSLIMLPAILFLVAIMG